MGSLTAADPSTRPAGSGRPAANHSARSAMRIVRPQPAGLRCRVRLADGRVFTGTLPPARHRAIQLGMLHADTAELVELTPGTRSLDGKLALDRRRRPEHYLPGGAAGRRDWLASLLAHAEQIVTGAYASVRAGAEARARRRSSASRREPTAAATNTRSRTAASCGSTSTSPASCPPCGRCWPSGRVTC